MLGIPDELVDDTLQMIIEEMDTERLLHPPVEEGTCTFCGRPTTDWDRCCGCGCYVCQSCMGHPEFAPFGQHEREAHKQYMN